jgi:hypothetical protein
MSTGKDNKSLPNTPEFSEHYGQIFKDRTKLDADVTRPRVARAVYVMRCETCDGVVLPQEAARWNCSRCGGKDCAGSVDVTAAPPLREEGEMAINANIMSGRFYEGTFTQRLDEKGQPVVIDLGSREKHKEYQRRHGLTTADDFDKPGGEWEKKTEERRQRVDPKLGGTPSERKERREMIERISYELSKKGNKP